MSSIMDPENRNNRQTVTRNCSFCRRNGHNILTCNDTQLRNFEAICYNNISSITNRNNMEDEFRNFLLSEWLCYPNYVKSFAIRYCRAPSRGNIDVIIDKIMVHFQPIIEYRRIILSRENIETFNELIHPNQREQLSITHRLLSREVHTLLFMEMIMSIHETAVNQTKKFDIKMNVCEKPERTNEKCECNICYEEYENKEFINFNCDHKFCKDCVKKSLQNEKRQNYCCPYCRTEIKEFYFNDEIVLNEFSNFI